MSELHQQSNSAVESDEISLKELIFKIKEWTTYLKSKWKLIIAISLLGGILGFVYAYFQKPTYKAVMTFVLEEEKSGGMGGALGLASSFGIDLGASGGGGLFTSSNILELMKSRYVVEKTLLNTVPYLDNGKNENISLAEYYIRSYELRKRWEKKPALKNIQFLPTNDRSKFTLQQDSILKNILSK